MDRYAELGFAAHCLGHETEGKRAEEAGTGYGGGIRLAWVDVSSITGTWPDRIPLGDVRDSVGFRLRGATHQDSILSSWMNRDSFQNGIGRSSLG